MYKVIEIAKYGLYETWATWPNMYTNLRTIYMGRWPNIYKSEELFTWTLGLNCNNIDLTTKTKLVTV